MTAIAPALDWARLEQEFENRMFHDPVMMAEVLQTLDLKPGATVVDGTLGLAGHAQRIVEQIAPGGTFFGFDWDKDMLAEAAERLGKPKGVSVTLIHDDYRQIPAELEKSNVKPQAIFLDLGLNSAQIEDPSRGIAFKTEGPLDMRFDRTRGEPASALLNRLSPAEIETLLWNNADERWAKAIAKEIVQRRRTKPLTTTTDLVDAVLAAVPPRARSKHINPATLTFQAVRIAVNRELEDFEELMESIARTLAAGGVLAVLSYHSGEDRPVKLAFRSLAATKEFEEVFKKPLQPTSLEVTRNPRSRSAKLRAIRKIGPEKK